MRPPVNGSTTIAPASESACRPTQTTHHRRAPTPHSRTATAANLAASRQLGTEGHMGIRQSETVAAIQIRKKPDA